MFRFSTLFGHVALHNVQVQHTCSFAKDVRFGPEVRASMMRGVNVLADAVAATMGPKGRNVIIDRRNGSPLITKDGATVANAIELEDSVESIGAKLVRDVAYKTNEETGDGTTTATILARAIAKGGFERISNGANPLEIRRGIMMALNTVKKQLQIMSRPVKTMDEMKQVAIISSNGDRAVGEVITKAMKRVGLDGVITVDDERRLHDELEFIDGINISSGYISPYFVNAKNDKVNYTNALLLISAKRISSVPSILPALELSISENRPLIIIAEDFNAEVLNTLVVNRLKMGVEVAAIRVPDYVNGRLSLLNDIAIASGSSVFDDDPNMAPIEKVQLRDLGHIGEITISKNNALMLNGKGTRYQLERRIFQLEDELLESISLEEKTKLQQRLASLTSGVAKLHVGGTNEFDMMEKKCRINDALNATRAAFFEGIVPGGGVALLRCIPYLKLIHCQNEDQKTGVDIIRRALRVPCVTIAENAGADGAMVVQHLQTRTGSYGYDAMKGEFGYLMEMGIYDPVKVVLTALVGAAGAASLLTTTEVAVTEINSIANLTTKPDAKYVNSMKNIDMM